jgi:hypothetical protein
VRQRNSSSVVELDTESAVAAPRASKRASGTPTTEPSPPIIASIRRVILAEGGGVAAASWRPSQLLVNAIGTGMTEPGSATAGAVRSTTATTRSGRSIAKRSVNQPPMDAPIRADPQRIQDGGDERRLVDSEIDASVVERVGEPAAWKIDQVERPVRQVRHERRPRTR